MACVVQTGSSLLLCVLEGIGPLFGAAVRTLPPFLAALAAVTCATAGIKRVTACFSAAVAMQEHPAVTRRLQCAVGNDPGLRVRYSVRELERAENKEKLNSLLRAFKKIKELEPTNPNSFFSIAGIHGEPFVSEPNGKTPARYWGGFCQHANVLFPTWHRLYVLQLENALRAVSGDPNLAMPYWDETSEETLREGLPKTLTDEKVEIDGEEVDNPLLSYTFQMNIKSTSDDQYYGKAKNTNTVRYPFSGIQTPDEAAKVAEAHNACIYIKFPTHKERVAALNTNFKAWLCGGKPVPETGKKQAPKIAAESIYNRFANCLTNGNYNSFSNTASSGFYLKKRCAESDLICEALEQPHNDVHLSIGGFDSDAMSGDGKPSSGIIEGANGDMGENETAAFDPIFFFHHCFIDRMLWLWQEKHNRTTGFELDCTEHSDPGLNPASKDGQGFTPGQYMPLTLQSELAPFRDGSTYAELNSTDCFDIRKLGYTYSPGSEPKPLPNTGKHFLHVVQIDRRWFAGSAVVRAFLTRPCRGKQFIGQRAILSRFSMQKCQNCQKHYTTSLVFDLADVLPLAHGDEFTAELVERVPLGAAQQTRRALGSVSVPASTSLNKRLGFTLEATISSTSS